MKTPQDIINEAALEAHPFDKKESSWHPYNQEQAKCQRLFVKGATFALSTPELWRKQGTKFLEWVGKNDWSYNIDSGKWYNISDDANFEGEITTDELFDLYLEQLSKQ